MFSYKSLVVLTIVCFTGCQTPLVDNPTISSVLESFPTTQKFQPEDQVEDSSSIEETLVETLEEAQTSGELKESVDLSPSKTDQPLTNPSATSGYFPLVPIYSNAEGPPEPAIPPHSFADSPKETPPTSDSIAIASYATSEVVQDLEDTAVGDTAVGDTAGDTGLEDTTGDTNQEFSEPNRDVPTAEPVRVQLSDSELPTPEPTQDAEVIYGDEFPTATEVVTEAYMDISLEEAVRLGLQNSKVIRDLGGTVLRNPDALASAYDPSITHSNPLLGEEAALSEFDAILNTSAIFENNDREVNNQFLGTNGVIQQDLGNLQFGITKRAATGGQFSIRTVSDYDNNNSIGNQFGNPSSSWQTFVEGELRQPLLRGNTASVNRITGPGAGAGEFNGIAIAKTRTNISVSEFKISVRNLVSDIENAYWDLYFAYRDLEAKKAARDNALQSWRRIKALGNEKKIGGEADKEGQAREQYFRFEAAVQDAMYGRPGDGTSSNNGSTPGTFRPVSGLKVAERRLRFLVGLELTDETPIRPIDEPVVVPTNYDRDSCLDIAFANRSELKRQLEQLRQIELQMLASKNALLPQLDFIGRYRFRGFGSDLIGDSSIPNDSALNDLTDGDHQEWQLGMELNIPLGFRREFAAIRNIEQRMLREKGILNEQKRQISADIGNALDNVKRAYLFHVLQHNRLIGALDQLQAVTITNEQKKAPLNLVLEAQRRVLDAQTELYRAKVEFALAKRNVEFEKGTLLPSMNVRFSDKEKLLDSNFCCFPDLEQQ